MIIPRSPVGFNPCPLPLSPMARESEPSTKSRPRFQGDENMQEELVAVLAKHARVPDFLKY